MQYLFILLPNGFHRITVSKDLTLSLSFSTFLSLFNPIYIFFLHGNPLKRNSAWGSLNKRHKKEIFPIPSVGVFVFLESENKYKLLIKQIKKINNWQVHIKTFIQSAIIINEMDWLHDVFLEHGFKEKLLCFWEKGY